MNSTYIKCVFCLKDFNLTTNIPYILHDCGHSVCKICLSYQINRYDSFECPEDGKQIQLKDKSMENFPQNRALINFLTQNNIEQPKARIHTEKKEKTKSLHFSRNLSEKNLKNLDKQKIESKSINQRLDLCFQKLNKIEPDFEAVISNSYSEENIEEVCKYHCKKLEVICMEDHCQKKICYQCGLFGKHKVN